MNLPTVVVCSCQASNAAPTAYATDPTKPIASIKEAWEGAKKRAGLKCRFQDLKHTAVSRMLVLACPSPK